MRVPRLTETPGLPRWPGVGLIYCFRTEGGPELRTVLQLPGRRGSGGRALSIGHGIAMARPPPSSPTGACPGPAPAPELQDTGGSWPCGARWHRAQQRSEWRAAARGSEPVLQAEVPADPSTCPGGPTLPIPRADEARPAREHARCGNEGPAAGEGPVCGGQSHWPPASGPSAQPPPGPCQGVCPRGPQRGGQAPACQGSSVGAQLAVRRQSVGRVTPLWTWLSPRDAAAMCAPAVGALGFLQAQPCP